MRSNAKEYHVHPRFFEVICIADIVAPIFFIWALFGDFGGEDYDKTVFLEGLGILVLIIWIVLFPMVMMVASRGIKSSGLMANKVVGYFRLALSVSVIIVRFFVGIAILIAMIRHFILK